MTELLLEAREQNERAAITGVLCHRAGYFCQILEGPELSVIDTYARIARDERHQDCTIITIATTTTRLFDGWAMGGIAEDPAVFVDVAEIRKLRRDDADGADAASKMRQWLKILNDHSWRTRSAQ